MTFNCDVSGNHGRLTDSDTLWRAAILHAEKRSHPPGEKNGKEKKKKKEEGKNRRRRFDASHRVVSINRVNSRENNSELMNITVAMATSIARNCFIFIVSRRAML